MRVAGNTAGLKARDRRALEKLNERRIPPAALLTPEFARSLAGASRAIGRQVGALINRRGRVVWVGVGDARQIELPDLKRQRVAGQRLRGLRCVHTHLAGEALTRDDLTDLVLLRLDAMAAVTVSPDGLPELVHAAHLRPGGSGNRTGTEDDSGTPWEILPPVAPGLLDLDCAALVAEIERSFARETPGRRARRSSGRAILAGVTDSDLTEEEANVDELAELATDAGLEVVARVVQRRPRLDPRTLLGRGKLEALVLRALDAGADVILFSTNLTPSQARNISAATDLRVLDRTQLILDVFARRARSREGKLQVELAQLRYRLPRLVRQDTSLSRLGGGIGGRGPGETRLEVDRRRARARIARLQAATEAIAASRNVRRRRRDASGLPMVALVGYTNAGKSTLLNRLTRSEVAVGDRMFETLDPANRRLRVPVEREVLLADTVGFIHDLPADLIEAFRATLEEIASASLLLHVVDASQERLAARAEAVIEVLEELGFARIPRIVLLNKVDRLAPGGVEALVRRLGGHGAFGGGGIHPVSATTGAGLPEVVRAVARLIPMRRPSPRRSPRRKDRGRLRPPDPGAETGAPAPPTSPLRPAAG